MNKRMITTRVMLDGVVNKTYTQMRRVYTDSKGEYVNCNQKRCHIDNDRFDIVYTTGKMITGSDLIKILSGVE